MIQNSQVIAQIGSKISLEISKNISHMERFYVDVRLHHLQPEAG